MAAFNAVCGKWCSTNYPSHHQTTPQFELVTVSLYRNKGNRAEGSHVRENVFILKCTNHTLKSENSVSIFCPYTRNNEHIIIKIIMFGKDQACFLFLDPQNETGPSISSSVVLCSFVLLVYIVVFVQLSCLCPSSVCVVATFSGTVLFPLLYSLLPFFP